MKQTIRLTENELTEFIKESVYRILNEKVNEFNDWKAQMLYGGSAKDYEGNPTNFKNFDGIDKANKIAKGQYNADAAGSDYVDTSKDYNTLQLDPNYGFMQSSENGQNGRTHNYFTIRAPKTYGKNDRGEMSYNSNNNAVGGGEYMGNMKTNKAKNFQQRLGNDMIDYYNGNYKERLKQKSSQLGNANSGQDFTPKVLKEAVSRAIRNYLY